ncbi:MAG: LamG-like jellyroll fold domain-containing protein [Bacteroidota bacterium]
MKKIVLISLAICLLGFKGFGQQTSAGKSFSVDYTQWCQLNYPSIYINCGNSDLFNTGQKITLEVWLRAYTFGENRKVMGKTTESFNSGYILGFENLSPYSEIYNPQKQEIPRTGAGPMPQDSAWIHLVTTYNGNGQMINYINGVNMGEITIFPTGNITSNTNPFIIGLAPWDLVSYEFVGDIDEVRVWNIEKSAQQIKDEMFCTLKGNETGLVAYYNFNNDTDSVAHDIGLNSLNGIVHNVDKLCFSWAKSFAPVADTTMNNMTDIQASWFGKDADTYTYLVTQNGISLITSIPEKDFNKYVICGHNNLTGVTSDGKPANAPQDFQRLGRVWYVNKAGSFPSDVVFDLQNASGGGQTLPVGAADSLYTLLSCDSIDGVYQPVYSATTVMNKTIMFNKVELSNKFYTIGYSSDKLANTAGISNYKKETILKFFPNPCKSECNIESPSESILFITDISGRLLKTENLSKGNHTINVESLPKGLYILKLVTTTNCLQNKLIKQ